MSNIRSFLGLILIFLLVTIPNVARAEQDIYLLQNTSDESFQFIKYYIKKNPDKLNESIQSLINKGKLTKITPEIASEEFGIIWKNSETSNKLPNLLIVKVKRDYELFTIDPIESNSFIVEYTGKQITDSESFERLRTTSTPYYFMTAGYINHTVNIIDARYTGGAARFALPRLDSRNSLQYKSYLQNDIESANVKLEWGPDNHLFLVATKNINSFERIVLTTDFPGYPIADSDDDLLEIFENICGPYKIPGYTPASAVFAIEI